jgi:GNAT superfamily N-acetyltransferase
MALSVVKATLNDVSTVTDFVMQLAVYEKLGHEVSFSDSQYASCLFTSPIAPSPEVLLIRDIGEITLGFAVFIHILPAVIHLEDLFVSPLARGKGAGSKLLASLAKLAIEQDVQSLEWACLDWNVDSLNFYRKIGAIPIVNRELYRITGDSLQRQPTNIGAWRLEETAGLPRSVELFSESGESVATVFFTLSFTTFLATPVVLVTEIKHKANDLTSLKIPIERLVEIANDNNFKRIDVRIDPRSQAEIAAMLETEFGAFQMTGWIPFSLSGAPLRALAERK